MHVTHYRETLDDTHNIVNNHIDQIFEKTNRQDTLTDSTHLIKQTVKYNVNNTDKTVTSPSPIAKQPYIQIPTVLHTVVPSDPKILTNHKNSVT